jgi:hypothetical protein
MNLKQLIKQKDELVKKYIGEFNKPSSYYTKLKELNEKISLIKNNK